MAPKINRTEFAGISPRRDITRPYQQYLLQSQDTLLVTKGQGDVKVYEKVLSDPQVKSCLQQRIDALICSPWGVEPGGTKRLDRKAAAHLQEQLTTINFNAVCERMLYGIFFGYSVAEVLYQPGAYVTIADILVRDRRRFRFAPDRTLRLLTPGNQLQGEAVPDAAFWVFSCGSSHSDNPYGQGLAHWLFWPVFFKRNATKFWNTYVERFAAGTLIGRFPVTATEDEQTRLLEVLDALISDASAAIPDTVDISVLESKRSGTSDYLALHEYMDRAISKIILSQTMTTDNGSSLAQAQVHQGVAEAIVTADAELLAASFNRTLAVWLTGWNFPGAAVPKLKFNVKEDEDVLVRVERDKKLFEIGWTLTDDEFAKVYGPGYQRREDSSVIAPETDDGSIIEPDTPDEEAPPDMASDAGDVMDDQNSTEFAKGRQPSETPVQIEDQLRRLGAKVFQNWVGQFESEVEQVFSAGGSLEDLGDRIIDVYGSLDVKDITDLLTHAMTIARVAGRVEADRDAG